MSKRPAGPVPESLWEEFLGYMSGSEEKFDDLPDGAWFAAMTEDVERFLDEHKIKGEAHEGMLQYVRATSKEVR